VSTKESFHQGRRQALKCLAFGGAGTLFTLSAGVLTPFDLALAAGNDPASKANGLPLFLQISDTHIGFNKEANPDVVGTLTKTIAMVNAMPQKPAMVIHTGDITHLSKASEFDTASLLLSQLNVTELHTTPGEHDVADASVTEYFSRYGKPSQDRGYYSFDHHGVHFISLINVLNFKPNGLGALGEEQLEWLEKDLRGRSTSTPIVVFAHMPLWTIYAPWGWGTSDADRAMSYLKRFGSVTVLNGHIHQIVQKVEGNITFHTARSTAYPQPSPGEGSGPGPLKVSAQELPGRLGVSNLMLMRHPTSVTVTDTTLA
jgi:3',5'-cyclic AMP phosphodiesterase CpdA